MLYNCPWKLQVFEAVESIMAKIFTHCKVEKQNTYT